MQADNVLRKRHRIKVIGGKVPPPLRSFQQLRSQPRCPAGLQATLAGIGCTVPTAIQRQAVPILLAGREVLAVAPTGGTPVADASGMDAIILAAVHLAEQPASPCSARLCIMLRRLRQDPGVPFADAAGAVRTGARPRAPCGGHGANQGAGGPDRTRAGRPAARQRPAQQPAEQLHGGRHRLRQGSWKRFDQCSATPTAA